jgi:hypothetical protein
MMRWRRLPLPGLLIPMLALFAFRAYASSNPLYGKVWYVSDEGEKIE